MMRADLALIGFGHVGRRFARLLAERDERLRSAYDLDCRIVAVTTARHGSVWRSDGLDAVAAAARIDRGGTVDSADGLSDAATSLETIARLGRSDADLRVVVETTTLDIIAGQPAITHVRAAIAAGCHVVTANKGPAAFEYAALRDGAASARVSFLFEGAVMDGIPIFNLVRETLPLVRILGFRGVVNSTTNHILSALEEGDEFAPALARMQAEGIAEANPSLDLDGWDAAAKTAALANVLMDARITPRDVHRTGIGPWSGDAARQAKADGQRLRLVASASRRSDGTIAAVVAPVALSNDDLLAGLRGPANALILRTDLLGDVAVCQLEGSLTHTAYALLGDLIAIRRRANQPA